MNSCCNCEAASNSALRIAVGVGGQPRAATTASAVASSQLRCTKAGQLQFNMLDARFTVITWA
jgi:hypothetical protein